MFFSPSNKEVLAQLNELVYGHLLAKKVLINLVRRSKMRYLQKWGLNQKDNLVPNVNALLIGESGTGKTHLVQSLSKLMDFPLISIDATQLMPTSASGGFNRGDIIGKIKQEASRLVETKKGQYHSYEGTLDQMIIFIDEIDKLSTSYDGGSTGKWNKGTQSNFLTLFENNTELTGLSFIFAGAFSGMDAGVSKSAVMGFHNSRYTASLNTVEINYDDAIIKYGLLPEIVGRVHHVLALDTLEDDDYRRILLTHILPEKRSQLSFYGIESFDLTEEQITKLIKKARDSGQGVRMLKKLVEKLAVDIEFEHEEYKLPKLPHLTLD